MTHPHPPRVLIAEDDTTLKDSLVASLRQDGYAAVAVEDAEGLIELACTAREPLPQLVIADLRDPDFEVVRLLESLPRSVLWGTPIIVVSRDGSSETAERARRIGSAVVVPRPLSAEELRELARALLPPPRPEA